MFGGPRISELRLRPAFLRLPAMDSEPPDSRDEDRKLALACLDGDAAAIKMLEGKYLNPLTGLLIKRGAYPTEAEDLVGGLLADCAVGRNDRGPLLERYNGRSSLRSWLTTVATHLLVDRLRRRKFICEPRSTGDDDDRDPMDRLARVLDVPAESDLMHLLLAGLKAGFDACPAEKLLMLRLMIFHDFSQRDLCRLWDWPEPRVSRQLKSAFKIIRTATVERVHQTDPALKLSLEDFVELCRTHELEFL